MAMNDSRMSAGCHLNRLDSTVRLAAVSSAQHLPDCKGNNEALMHVGLSQACSGWPTSSQSEQDAQLESFLRKKMGRMPHAHPWKVEVWGGGGGGGAGGCLLQIGSYLSGMRPCQVLGMPALLLIHSCSQEMERHVSASPSVRARSASRLAIIRSSSCVESQ